MKIKITSGDVVRDYTADSWRKAVRMFFNEVTSRRISIASLGIIGEWHDEEDDYPFRIAPALFTCGLITHSQMLNLFKLAQLDFSPSEVKAMVREDAWMTRASDVEEVETVQ